MPLRFLNLFVLFPRCASCTCPFGCQMFSVSRLQAIAAFGGICVKPLESNHEHSMSEKSYATCETIVLFILLIVFMSRVEFDAQQTLGIELVSYWHFNAKKSYISLCFVHLFISLSRVLIKLSQCKLFQNKSHE